MFRLINLYDQDLIVYSSGLVLKKSRNKWYAPKYQLSPITTKNKKQYEKFDLTNKPNRHSARVHRLVASAFLGLDYYDSSEQVDHIDGDTLNNNMNNLRVGDNQSNQFNNTAYGVCERDGKFRARIRINNLLLHIGTYNEEQIARQKYLDAKQKYHIFGKKYTDEEVEQIRKDLKNEYINFLNQF